MSQDMNENIGIITYIMLGRIYDLLVLLAKDNNVDNEELLKMIELHRQGHLMSPLPSLINDEKEED
jgi:hypothetical protein